jgi:hypothetical protein
MKLRKIFGIFVIVLIYLSGLLPNPFKYLRNGHLVGAVTPTFLGGS